MVHHSGAAALSGVPVALEEMLEARERRAVRQRELLDSFHLPLVSFTMNIAGPVKNSVLIRRGFAMGDALLRKRLSAAHAACIRAEQTDAPTGCEALYVVDMDPHALKALTEEIEERAELGRLYDMDVLSPAGEKLDRAVPRRCLLCGEDAKSCARSRRHTVAELQAKTRELLETAQNRQDAETVGELACRALLYEVGVTPKPGLVDRMSNGSHRDMDMFTFFRSAAALWPYFADCQRMGRRTADRAPKETFDALRWPGQLAEHAMFAATGGVNTHKGAVFTMGLACAALGRLDRTDWSAPERVLREVAAMAEGLSARDFAGLTEETARTAGERLYLRCGLTGVRGQAEAGFPAALEYGLPALEDGLARGKSPDEAGSAALLSLLVHTVDTNLLSRWGTGEQREEQNAFDGLETLRRELSALLDGSPGRGALERLDETFIRRNLSPGGSADLLALCWFLHFLREEA